MPLARPIVCVIFMESAWEVPSGLAHRLSGVWLENEGGNVPLEVRSRSQGCTGVFGERYPTLRRNVLVSHEGLRRSAREFLPAVSQNSRSAAKNTSL